MLYGSAAAGEHIPKRSDYNVLVLLESLDDAQSLVAASAVARAWREAGNPPPMTMTRRGVARLGGHLPDGVRRHPRAAIACCTASRHSRESRVDRADLRLQLEQQVMGKLLQLRQGALLAGTDGKRQVELLAASLSTMMVLFRAVLRLHGEPPTGDNATTATRVGALAGFDAAPFSAPCGTSTAQRSSRPTEAGQVLSRIPGGRSSASVVISTSSVRHEVRHAFRAVGSLGARAHQFSISLPRNDSHETSWLALLLPLALGACGYNTIQPLDEQANSAQGQIEVQLQRRADLIPNLVATVKGMANQELAVFGEVARARGGLLNAVQSKDPEQMANANAAMTGALGRLLAVSEAYPQLKSDQSFLRLQDELAGTENRIAVSQHGLQRRGAAVQRVHPSVPGGAHGEDDGREGAEVLPGDERRRIARTRTVDFGTPGSPATAAPADGSDARRAPARRRDRRAPAEAVGAEVECEAGRSCGRLLFRKERLALAHLPSGHVERRQRVEALLRDRARRAELRPQLLRLLRHERREEHRLPRELAHRATRA